MSENSELEDLDQLVHSAGWGRFVAMVESLWGRGGSRFIDGVTAAAKADNTHGPDHLRQIIASQREIAIILQMPEDRLKLLKQPQLVGHGQSRRGGL